MNKDRIKELKRVKASELIPNPKNWRTHPIAQKNALSSVLNSIGYADAVLARETDDGLMLIDGHMRAELTPDEEIPVLVLDITEQESDLLLATHDPISAMAGKDDLILKNLLSDITAQSEPLNDLLTELAGKPPEIPDPDDWQDHWKGMPEFEQDEQKPFRTLIVHFKTQDDVNNFVETIQQEITEKTKSIWHPEAIRTREEPEIYVDVTND
tara:strand:+ start:49 stop:684 length:636 start_codon:yes stop_codon:yes gene_type:complete